MKTKITLSIIISVLSLIGMKAQTPVLEVFATDDPRTLTTSVISGPASTINWEETSDPNSIVTLSTLIGGTTVATFNALATVNQEATISVSATPNTTSCSSDAKLLIIRIKDPGSITNSASITSLAKTICEASAPGNFTISFNNNVTSYKYYIDEDNSGVMDGTETLQTEVVANTNSATLNIATTLSANASLRIVSVTGSAITSPSSENQLVTVNPKPVISDIQF